MYTKTVHLSPDSLSSYSSLHQDQSATATISVSPKRCQCQCPVHTAFTIVRCARRSRRKDASRRAIVLYAQNIRTTEQWPSPHTAEAAYLATMKRNLPQRELELRLGNLDYACVISLFISSFCIFQTHRIETQRSRINLRNCTHYLSLGDLAWPIDHGDTDATSARRQLIKSKYILFNSYNKSTYIFIHPNSSTP